MQFKVQLSRANLVDGRFLVEVTNFAAQKTYYVDAGSLQMLTQQVRALARDDYRHHCTAYVTVPRGVRKPKNFDAAMRQLERIEVHNVEVPELVGA